MPYKFTALPQIKLNLLYFLGPLGRGDFEEPFELQAYSPTFDDLVVYALDASFAGVDFEAAKSQAERLVRAGPSGKPKRRALVTANAMQGVLGRMFLGFLRSIAPSDFEIECFDNLATAVAWLAAGRTSFEPIDRAVVLRALEEFERPDAGAAPNAAAPLRR